MAHYNQNVLPCVIKPFANSQEVTKRYLGGKAITGDVYVQMRVATHDDVKERLLYDFWATDCNYGVEPFTIDIPIFGDQVTYLVGFVGDYKSGKSRNGQWSSSFKLKLFGTIVYVIDGLGNYVISDLGEYTITESGDYVRTNVAIGSHKLVIDYTQGIDTKSVYYGA